MTKNGLGPRVLPAVLTALATMLWPGIATGQDFDWRGRISAGQTIEVRGINGAISAIGVDGTQARVSAQKEARRSDPDDVRIEIVEHSGGVLVCAVYPSRDEDDPNRCELDGNSSNIEDNDVTVDFQIEVPRGVAFVGNTVNGEVSADVVDSDVEANTVNGSIDIRTAGRAEAHTVNGTLDIQLDRADWSGTLSFGTVNGSITIALPPNPDVEVRASSVSGGIATDFPLTVRGRFATQRMSGTIGRGGRTLDLSVVNGQITLREN